MPHHRQTNTVVMALLLALAALAASVFIHSEALGAPPDCPSCDRPAPEDPDGDVLSFDIVVTYFASYDQDSNGLAAAAADLGIPFSQPQRRGVTFSVILQTWAEVDELEKTVAYWCLDYDRWLHQGQESSQPPRQQSPAPPL